MSEDECREGSEFIQNAAHSRNNGITKFHLLEQFDADIITIQSFPPEYRWFVQDKEDEVFLRSALLGVFDDPKTPEKHATDFLSDCMYPPSRQQAHRQI